MGRETKRTTSARFPFFNFKEGVMEIKFNPLGQAEEDLRNLLKPLPLDADTKIKLLSEISKIVEDTVRREKFFIEAHPDCGADNPKGLVKLCNCACHNGHYKHYWDTKNPVMKIHRTEDGSFHILERCKYCADTRLKVIKSMFVGEEYKLVTLEYHIRGELRVLTREEWIEKKPKDFKKELTRQVNL